jgi:hypothetical protein
LVDDPSILPIIDQLRTYVAERPSAIDTVRGIRDWWLTGLDPLPKLASVAAALRQLEAEGLLEQVVLPDGGVLWRVVRTQV